MNSPRSPAMPPALTQHPDAVKIQHGSVLLSVHPRATAALGKRATSGNKNIRKNKTPQPNTNQEEE